MVTSKRRLSTGEKVSKGFLYGFLLLLTSVAVLNAQPYILASSSLFGDVVVIPGVDLLARLPGVAPIFALMGMVLPPMLGVVVWAVLQFLQCIPLFMADPQMLRKQIYAARDWSQINFGIVHVDWVNDLIERFMKFPLRLQKGLIKGAAISYFVDFAIGAWHYPPLNVPVQSVKEAWGYLMQLLRGDFDFGLVDWESVAKLAVMLFAFEGLIALLLFIRQIGLYLLGNRHDTPN